MPVTLADVAARAGFAVPTVCKALSGKGIVAADTRERIRAAADELGYRANSAARAMLDGRFHTLGFLQRLESGWQPRRLLHGAEQAARQRDHHLQFHRVSPAELADEQRAPRLLREASIDGALVHMALDVDPQLEAAVAALRVPVVWINGRADGPCVLIDDAGASADATARLIALGHRRIAYLGCTLRYHDGDGGHHSLHDRPAGYREAMQAAGLAAILVEPHYRAANREQGWAQDDDRIGVARRLLRDQRPTAVVCGQIEAAYPLVAAAQGLGLSIPTQLSIAVLEAEPAFDVGLPLSTWIHPWDAVGRRAVELLLDDGDPPRQPICIPYTEVVGETLAPPTDA